MNKMERSPRGGEEKKNEDFQEVLKEVRSFFWFNLNQLFGEGWQEQVEDVENEDFQGALTESGPDRHVISIKLKDGRIVKMMSARVKSGNPFEHMEYLGGADFRKTESWLYAYDPKGDRVTIISPDGVQTEVKGSREDFDAQMKNFRDIYANEEQAIAAFGESIEKKQE